MSFEPKKKPGDGLVPDDKPSSVIVKKGFVYTLTPENCKKGVVNDRYWMFIVDKAKKGFNKMQIWVKNAEECYSADKIRVTEVVQAEVETRMFENKFYQNFKSTVVAEPMETQQKNDAEGGFVAFTETLSGDTADLPFM